MRFKIIKTLIKKVIFTEKSDKNNSSVSQPSTSFASFNSEEFLNNIDDDNSDLGDLIKTDISKILSQPQKVISHPINIVQAVENRSKPLRSIDPEWLNRVSLQNGQSNTLINSVNEKEESVSCATKLDYDSDDIIEDSGDESTSTQQHHVAKKIKTDKEIFNNKENIGKQENVLETYQKNNAVITNECVQEEKVQKLQRSARPVNLMENSVESDDEQDPFHSDNDGNDPEYKMQRRKKDKEVAKPHKSPKENKKKEKRSRKSKKENKINDEDAPYELDYSVKPRIVKPRYSIKRILTETAESVQKPMKKVKKITNR